LVPGLPTFKGKSLQEIVQGVRAVWLNVLSVRNSSSARRVLSWLHFEWQLLTASKKELPRPTTIIVSSLSLFSILSGFYFAKKYRARFLVEIRDIWPLSAMQLGGYSPYHPFIWLLARIEKFGYKNADTIIGTMPNLQEHVRKVYPAFKKCICIPQGVNLSFYQQKQEKLPDSYVARTFSKKSAFYVAYTGTMNDNNPLDTLLESASQLKDEQQIHFLILGRGAKKEYYEHKYGALPNVSFPNPIPKNQVHDFLSRIDLTFDSILPSLAIYGLSRNKWIDYMFAACPVVCSYTGYKSMINEANCGRFVPFGDVKGLVEVIRSYASMPEEERKKIGERGKSYLLRYRTFDKLAQQYAELFMI
jgi:glycosyltransferase involved in cell wall biosynthesis